MFSGVKKKTLRLNSALERFLGLHIRAISKILGRKVLIYNARRNKTSDLDNFDLVTFDAKNQPKDLASIKQKFIVLHDFFCQSASPASLTDHFSKGTQIFHQFSQPQLMNVARCLTKQLCTDSINLCSMPITKWGGVKIEKTNIQAQVFLNAVAQFFSDLDCIKEINTLQNEFKRLGIDAKTAAKSIAECDGALIGITFQFNTPIADAKKKELIEHCAASKFAGAILNFSQPTSFEIKLIMLSKSNYLQQPIQLFAIIGNQPATESTQIKEAS